MSELFDRYVAMRTNMDEHVARNMSHQAGAASAYVWGWQDARKEAGLINAIDTAEATTFGWAYGIVVALYDAYVIPFRPPIGAAYESWRMCGHIRETWRGAETDFELIDPPVNA